MAFADSISLSDGTNTRVFVLQSRLNGGCDYIWDGSTAALTRRLKIRHTNVGASVVKGQRPVRRHLAQLITESFNTDLGKTESVTTNYTLTVDPGSTLTTAPEDHRKLMEDFLTTTSIAQLVRDEA